MKTNYSGPTIYTGGVDITRWSKLTQKQKQVALSKDWYVYYSYRHPETGNLKRQTPIKGRANRFKNKRARYAHLKTLERNLLYLLELGFNPYQDNTELKNKYFPGKTVIESLKITGDGDIKNQEKTDTSNSDTIPQSNDIAVLTFQECKEKAMPLKERMMSESSFKDYTSRINQFSNWLEEKDLVNESITKINKKIVVEYLNTVLLKSSPRNRNNTRTDLSSFFQVLVDNDIIEKNFMKEISVLKSVPTRNKTYTLSQQKDLYNYMKENNPILLLFVKFISYNLLRPIEVCRLKVKDIDLEQKVLYVRAKNQPVKTKIIPDLLSQELKHLKDLNPEHFLFTPKKIGGEWNTKETNKRDYFTKQFKKVKDQFGLGKEYGLYSFRHTFITKLYREISKTSTPYETKSKLMLITGHTSMTALNKYLRDIDAELPKDYSDFLK